MKNIYVVRTTNFTDTLYFATWKDAVGFAEDQVEMGYKTGIRKRQVSTAEFNQLMATMQQLDAGAVKFFAAHSQLSTE
jgi:hypothetical protein